jgi:hypothetical protein
MESKSTKFDEIYDDFVSSDSDSNSDNNNQSMKCYICHLKLNKSD